MISIFKSYENRFNNSFDEKIEEFEKFINRITKIYGTIDFKDYNDYQEDWSNDDTINYRTYPLDGYSRILHRFDMTLGIYANLNRKWIRDEFEMINYVAKDRDVNFVTFFMSDKDIKPEVAALKEKLTKERPNRFIDLEHFREFYFHFMLQLSGLDYLSDIQLVDNCGSIEFGSVHVAFVHDIPFLEHHKKDCQQILDALWFSMELLHRRYRADHFLQMPALIKTHKNKSIAKLLNYDDIHATIKKQIKLHQENHISYSREEVFLALDKLKLFALNARIIDHDSAESTRLQRKYYKERYHAATQCELPLYTKAKALFDYTKLLKSKSQINSLMEECVAQHFKMLQEGRPKSEGYIEANGAWHQHKDYTNDRGTTYKELYLLDMLHDKIIAYHEKRRNYEKVKQLCIFEINRYKARGYSIDTHTRMKTLYSKLMWVRKSELT